MTFKHYNIIHNIRTYKNLISDSVFEASTPTNHCKR